MTNLTNKTIGFIGAGNMGQSIIEGLLQSDDRPKKIYACDHHPERISHLYQKGLIELVPDNGTLVKLVDIVILAVKPQSMKPLFAEIKEHLYQSPLIISIAAGITLKQIRTHLALSHDYPLVRIMPNTPALIQKGVIGLYADNIDESQKELAEIIMQKVGACVWLTDEKHMDVVTALSGSGPAYFFYFLDAMIQEAVRLGLSEETAKTLTFETGLGAIEMAKSSKESLNTLRQKVTSKGGTTEAGLDVFQENHLDKVIAKAIHAATQRGEVLSKNLDHSK